MFGRKKRQQRRSAILEALLDGPTQGMTGLDLCRKLDREPGTIYPDLAHLEREEWITSYWEDPVPGERRPQTLRRRYYKLSAHGRTRVLAALGRYNP